jgi:hypothetical protein
MFIALIVFTGCGDGSSSTVNAPAGTHTVTGQELADTVVAQWLDVDFSLNNPDGISDSDFDGGVDTNDAVNFVESLKFMGHDIPETLINGLYNNYYTVNGYAEILGTSPEIDFTYTVDNPISEADLQAYDWSGLEVGDLIFVDYDKDFVWDFAAVYLGASSGFTHAVVFASDYYDKVVIEDLDEPSSIIVQDITYGYSDVRTPAYEVLSNY